MKPYAQICSLALLLGGCACGSSAHLSNTWVVEAGPGRAGLASQPHNAEPITVSGPDECIAFDAFDRQFGKPCESHETEGGASPDMGGGLPVGPHPTANEVRWYCQGQTVVRLVIQRCTSSDSFRIVDVAVSLAGGR
jgi:hypothetical protein